VIAALFDNNVAQDENIVAPMVDDAAVVPNPPLINFQQILAAQGVSFQDGVPPPITNVQDSPMQTWHDSISDVSDGNSSGSDLMQVDTSLSINYALVNDNLLDVSSEIWMTRNFAKSTFKEFCFPNFALDNAKLLPITLSLPKFMQFEFVDEWELLLHSRKGQVMNSDKNLVSSGMLSFTQVGTKRKIPELDDTEVIYFGTPISTNQVRRSSRSTRYRGFKPKIICDSKHTKSKVKPRKIPEVQAVEVTEETDMTEINSVHVDMISDRTLLQLQSQCSSLLESLFVVFLRNISLL